MQRARAIRTCSESIWRVTTIPKGSRPNGDAVRVAPEKLDLAYAAVLDHGQRPGAITGMEPEDMFEATQSAVH